MDYKKRKPHKRKIIEYRYIIYLVIIVSLLQFWTLKTYFEDIEFKIPKNLFSAPVTFPISESIIESSYDKSELISLKTTGEISNSKDDLDEIIISELEETGEDIDTEGLLVSQQEEEAELTEIQKKIVLRALELLDENMEYKYEYYPETGYPTENVGVSTDVVAIVLRDCGYDLMELIYEDMSEHKEAYPMDITGSKSVNKYSDFRHVFYQETFFKRHALELPSEYIFGDENNNIQWQPGDIVFFQIDEDNPHKDVAGIISSRKNDNGVPLVIINTKELGEISEVDILLDPEYKIKSHFRYPYPEV